MPKIIEDSLSLFEDSEDLEKTLRDNDFTIDDQKKWFLDKIRAWKLASCGEKPEDCFLGQENRITTVKLLRHLSDNLNLNPEVPSTVEEENMPFRDLLNKLDIFLKLERNEAVRAEALADAKTLVESAKNALERAKERITNPTAEERITNPTTLGRDGLSKRLDGSVKMGGFTIVQPTKTGQLQVEKEKLKWDVDKIINPQRVQAEIFREYFNSEKKGITPESIKNPSLK